MDINRKLVKPPPRPPVHIILSISHRRYAVEEAECGAVCPGEVDWRNRHPQRADLKSTDLTTAAFCSRLTVRRIFPASAFFRYARFSGMQSVRDLADDQKSVKTSDLFDKYLFLTYYGLLQISGRAIIT